MLCGKLLFEADAAVLLYAVLAVSSYAVHSNCNKILGCFFAISATAASVTNRTFL